jgi:hypothetical protein
MAAAREVFVRTQEANMTSSSTPLTPRGPFESVIQPFRGFAPGSGGGDDNVHQISATNPKWLLIEADLIDVALILSTLNGVQKVTRVSGGLWKVLVDRDIDTSAALYNSLRMCGCKPEG